ncbi:MAG: hypothetical protein JNM56_38930 [Planctomycetia bacterium]|nr:hypothetical protein [Planctomycetia bacterium]
MSVARLLTWCLVLCAAGCGQLAICPPQPAADPAVRMRELLNGSSVDEVPHLAVQEEWLRAWFNDALLPLNPIRIHGGIQ